MQSQLCYFSFSYFRMCNIYEDAYDNFSEQVDKTTYKATINHMKTLYPSCKSFLAWNPVYVEEYQNCTNEIIKESTTAIKENIDIIQHFAMEILRGKSIKIEFKKILSVINAENDIKSHIKLAIAHIKNETSSSTESLSCSEIDMCLEIIREVILRLKLIEVGGFGPTVSNAGLFLAFHHNILGCVMKVLKIHSILDPLQCMFKSK